MQVELDTLPEDIFYVLQGAVFFFPFSTFLCYF